MKIAIEGCAHGELDKIYATLEYIERTENVKIDLLLVCGDFQSLRNVADLDVLACPAKYRTMGTFYQYYSGQKKAPYPTIFVGGNHEASNYLWELFHGGWVCPNIYFLGFAGVIKFGGLRIGGLTGIYKDQDYEKGYFEQQPYDDSASRSIYHVRKFNVYRLLQLAHSDRLDVFLSHDWPRGIAYHGNHKALLSSKPFLREEVNTNTLGSMPAELLLQNLKPRYWFAAHLHVKFAALVKHDAGQSNSEVHVGSAAQANAESGDVSRDAGVPADAMAAVHDALEAEVAHTIGGDTLESLPAATTRFLALDKCVPNRDFLQIIDVPEGDASKGFAYDPYWLAVVRATNDFLSFSVSQIPLPENEEAQGNIAAQLAWIRDNLLSGKEDIPILDNFVVTAAPHNPQRPMSGTEKLNSMMPHLNPQTAAFCEMLQMTNHINPGGRPPWTPAPETSAPPPDVTAASAVAATDLEELLKSGADLEKMSAKELLERLVQGRKAAIGAAESGAPGRETPESKETGSGDPAVDEAAPVSAAAADDPEAESDAWAAAQDEPSDLPSGDSMPVDAAEEPDQGS